MTRRALANLLSFVILMNLLTFKGAEYFCKALYILKMA